MKKKSGDFSKSPTKKSAQIQKEERQNVVLRSFAL